MKRIFLTIVILLSIGLRFSTPAFAQNATCDQCGYCQGAAAPSTWEQCRDCLYPNIHSAATANETLKLDTAEKPFEDIVPTTVPGNYYTGIGCIKSGGFTKTGSAGAVAQVILNLIFSMAGGIAFLYILFGAFQVATSQNNPEKLNYGKRLIIGSVVGLIISLSAVFLVNLIGNQILKIPGFGG
jgi:hypothetical protein